MNITVGELLERFQRQDKNILNEWVKIKGNSIRNDWLYKFLNRQCVVDERETADANALYRTYKKWAKIERKSLISKEHFAKEMEARGFYITKISPCKRGYRGIKLVGEDICRLYEQLTTLEDTVLMLVRKENEREEAATIERKKYIMTKKEEIVNSSTIKVRNEDILKESDNIQDLCDCFITIPNNKKDIPRIYKNWSSHLKDFKDKEVYGAIQIDVGFRYVAKMNEKGELELL